MRSKKYPVKRLLILFLVVINLICLGSFLVFYPTLQKNKEEDKRLTDILTHKTKEMDFDQLSTFFKDLAKAKGGVYAFDTLGKVMVAPNTDMHLLGHVVGDELYKQRGIDGITDCTQDFRNACSHSIVVGAFSDLGEKALPIIAKTCEKAPGGKGAYTMCFHGLGHGVLAYYEYEFPKMIASCQKTGTSTHNYQEFPECIGGAVMEIISGGGHDRELWEKRRKEYLIPSDPLSLCSAEKMPEQARRMCYTYITPYLWEAVSGNTDLPSPDTISKSFQICNELSDTMYRDICFGGFGKEFIALATERDIRQVENITPFQAKTIHNFCLLAPNPQAITNCVTTTVGSLFWGGENDPKASVLFCKQFANSQYEKGCYDSYIGNIMNFLSDAQKANACALLPREYQSTCSTPS